MAKNQSKDVQPEEKSPPPQDRAEFIGAAQDVADFAAGRQLIDPAPAAELGANAAEAKNDQGLEALGDGSPRPSICGPGCERCGSHPGPFVQGETMVFDKIEFPSTLEQSAIEIATGIVSARAAALGMPYLSALAGTGTHDKARTEAELETVAIAAANVARRVLAKCEDVQLAE